MRQTRLRKAFTLVELLVVIAIIGILIGMLLPAVQSVREAARRIDCGNKMRQLALSFHNYESSNMHFPAGMLTRQNYTASDASTKGFGWAVQILPQIEQTSQFDLLSSISNNLATPAFTGTVGGNSIDSTSVVLNTFLCPSDTLDNLNPFRDNLGKSNYVAIWGDGSKRNSGGAAFLNNGIYEASDVVNAETTKGICFVNSRTTIGSISDGTTNTFLLGERDGGPIVGSTRTREAATWIGLNNARFLHATCGPTAPVNTDGTNGNGNFLLNPVSTGNPGRQIGLGSLHTGGANFARADASVSFIADTIQPFAYSAGGTIAGGEVADISL